MLNYDDLYRNNELYKRSLDKSEVGSVSYYHSHTNSSFSHIHQLGRMQGAKRVIVFCLLIAVLPVILLFIPLYLRHRVYADVKYQVAESDILEMINGISSVFCQEHSLKMDTPFNAFQTKGKPEMSKTIRKHIRLKKSMMLPDDTLEYWGFFLPSSSTVHLSVCSRYDGSCILVVKGEKNLRDCGLMQPTKPLEHVADNKNLYVTEESAILIVAEEQETEREPIDPEENGGEVIDDNEEKITTTESNNTAKRTNATIDTKNEELPHHKHRHERSRFSVRKRALENELNRLRRKRQAVTYKLDGGIAHGGNALNYSSFGNDSSVSSFESSLLSCYKGQTLLFREFASSRQCNSTAHLEKETIRCLASTKLNVLSQLVFGLMKL
ncbi:uncharacterized protein isoform X2 [Rhodnius prolixus]|uniref:uncharacterized protein isoform X2 n=1 Tax=Rhodnius prolixus TaxID=13249 RepID=UPI003D18891A